MVITQAKKLREIEKESKKKEIYNEETLVDLPLIRFLVRSHRLLLPKLDDAIKSGPVLTHDPDSRDLAGYRRAGGLV